VVTVTSKPTLFVYTFLATCIDVKHRHATHLGESEPLPRSAESGRCCHEACLTPPLHGFDWTTWVLILLLLGVRPRRSRDVDAVYWRSVCLSQS